MKTMKKKFEQIVNGFYTIKYRLLFLFSALYSLVLWSELFVTLFFAQNPPYNLFAFLKKEESLIFIFGAYFAFLFLSQVCIFCTRFYRSLEKISEIFKITICIGKKPDLERFFYKAENFLIALAGHFALLAFMLKATLFQ